MTKRVFDLIFGTFAFLIFSPIMLLVYIYIYKHLGKPVIFSQRRPGKDEKIFNLYKFRTMKEVYDSSGNQLPDEYRVTSAGNKIRKLSLDELPQLINVIKGDLSIVGPRPLLEEYLPLYSREEKKRHLVKPGLTGWAQVNGRNNLSWKEKFQYDIWYVNNQSLRLDIKIILLTFMKVLRGNDVQKEGHVSTEKFRGNED